MAKLSWTLDAFRRSGKSHIACAKTIVSQCKSKTADIRAGSAAYFAHLALECILKALVLQRGGYAEAAMLELRQPSLYKALFKGSGGHDLATLATHLGLPKVCRNEGLAWNEDPCWRRLSAPPRPYSLRYGAEVLSIPDAEDEITRADAISTVVLRILLPTMKPKKTRRWHR